jgi:hypothetical protein
MSSLVAYSSKKMTKKTMMCSASESVFLKRRPSPGASALIPRLGPSQTIAIFDIVSYLKPIVANSINTSLVVWTGFVGLSAFHLAEMAQKKIVVVG